MTHVPSSGVAGATLAKGSGVQFAALRNIVHAWVRTLSATLSLIFRHFG